MKTLFRKNSFGVGRWVIFVDGNTINIGHSSTLDGPLIMHQEVVERGLAGRSLDEQIQSRVQSRINKQLDKGYKFTKDEAAAGNVNTLGLHQPMLAKPIDKVKSISQWYKTKRFAVQPKLNGHRCLIANDNGNIVAYSRQGKPITAIDHVLQEIEGFIPEGVCLDGELYCHGQSLQTISSWVKRKQPNTGRVVYYTYDVITGDSKPYNARHQLIQDIFGGRQARFARALNTRFIDEWEDSEEVIRDLYTKFMDAGFEGAMVRDLASKYECGKRSSGLLKMKPVYDTEVEVVDIIPGEGDVAICVCKMEGLGKTFKTLAPGPILEKVKTYHTRDKFIGRRLKIEYRELTDESVPFHAAALEWYSEI